MIKRQYFIYAEITLPTGMKVQSWRQCWWRSFLPQPAKVLAWKEKVFAESNGVEVDQVAIKSFNKC